MMNAFRFGRFITGTNGRRMQRELSTFGTCLPQLPEIPSTLPSKIAFGSCCSQKEDLFIFETIRRAKPDLLILMGDNVYGEKNAKSLQSAYETFAADASVRKCLLEVPILPILDDNDYLPTYEEGKNMFLDFFHVRADDPRRKTGRGAYHALSWGEELQILLLDVRYHADSFELNHNRSSMEGPYRQSSTATTTLLGKQQWAWLEEKFRQPCQLRLIVSPIQVLPTNHRWDCWNLFPHERHRLLQNISETRSKTLILSGDRHVGAIYQQGHLYEVTSSSLTHSVPLGLLDHETDPARVGSFLYRNNFGLLDIDWDNHQTVSNLLDSMSGVLLEHAANPLIVK